ncbi:HlyD family efflux transporter periplasmic adaptor subunit [bacterium]|nr:HlyD family efflux transporter periplasmic adaptor subunit [bacterium]
MNGSTDRLHHALMRNAAVTTMILLLLAGCNSDTGKRSMSRLPGTPVKTVRPLRSDLTEFVNMNAYTKFLRKESVRATFQGFVADVRKNIGDRVAVNDTLLRMRTREAAADDSLAVRVGETSFSGVVVVRAHTAGILTSLPFKGGDFVNEGEQVAEIVDLASMRIVLNVPYQYAAALKPHATCTLQLPDGHLHPARVEHSLPSVDPVSQTQSFLLRTDGMGFLPEHLNLQARVPIRTVHDALVLPRSAVMCDEMQTQFWVMRVAGDTLALRVNIEPGLETDSLVQVLHPALDSAALYISKGAFGLADSARITLSR